MIKKDSKLKSLDKNIGVLYESPVDFSLHVYKAVHTVEEAVQIITTDVNFKNISKSKVLIVEIQDDKQVKNKGKKQEEKLGHKNTN